MNVHPGAAVMALNGECASGDRPRCLEPSLPGRAFCKSHAEQLDRIREQLDGKRDEVELDEVFDA